MAEEAQKTPNDIFTELDTTLTYIQSLLHGAIASAEFFPNQKAEVHLLHLATDLTEKAVKLVDTLHRASRKPPAGTVPPGQDKQE
jgi:hypothetical protein